MGSPKVNRSDLVCRNANEVFQLTVVNGSSVPKLSGATQAQQMAIGTINGTCTGTLISERWIITAKHCIPGEQSGPYNFQFRTGRNGDVLDISLSGVRAIVHPDNPSDLDVALLELDAASAARVPTLGIQPIGIYRGTPDNSWAGSYLEAAGLGSTAAGAAGQNTSGKQRGFVRERVVEVQGRFVKVDGEGRNGVCFGDSGGPLLAPSSGGAVIIGTLTGGVNGAREDCVSQDVFTRSDVVRQWVEQNIGGPSGKPLTCDNGDPALAGQNFCYGNMVIKCESGRPEVLPCDGEDEMCGWDVRSNKYNCIRKADDPCMGMTEVGACEQDSKGRDVFAKRCAYNRQKARVETQLMDCSKCTGGNYVCAMIPEDGSVGCRLDECGGVSSVGSCDGNTAVWCEGGTVQRLDCSKYRNARCGPLGDGTRFGCVAGTGPSTSTPAI